MKKQWNIIKLVLIAVIFLVGGYTAMFGIAGYGSAKNIILGLDVRGGVSITYEVADEDFTMAEFEDTKSKLESRAQALSTEAEVYQEGERRIVVNIPGETDAEATLNKLGQPGSISFVTYEADGSEKVWLDGEDIQTANAREAMDDLTSKVDYQVQLSMTSAGAQKFAEATTANIGQPIYIVYDGEVISAPTVKSAITGGEAVIENIDSEEEAKYLATMIRIGNLKLNLETISHKTVGAKLGAEALSKSITAGLIGLLLICLFMIVVYRVPGIVASFALFFYTVLVILCLNGFNLTLTLPGIAGIILGIGMAVDANVIIYTRIREEIAAGEPVGAAIKTGFNKANSAIIDGNVTTLIAAIVLMWKGSGTVQGFAQTLAVGIVVSMITALIISRIIVMSLYRLGVKDEKYYGTEKTRKTIDFVSHKNIFFIVSVVVIVLGLGIGVMNKANGKGMFNTSVEFQGGNALTIDFDQTYSIEAFNTEIQPKIAEIIGSNDIQGQKETNSNTYTIKMPSIDESLMTDVKEMLINDFAGDAESIQESFISATISNEMTNSAVVATILATICMLIYIYIRFSNVRYAFSAVAALIHDVLVLLGFYMVSRTSVGTAFIACVLTIVGYSINATIVIFDRIRENNKLNTKKRPLNDIINDSITQTLTRTIYTSLTTFVTVLMIFVLGVPAMQEFTMPIMVGIIVGGYSSVCITGSLLFVMAKGESLNPAVKKAAKKAAAKNSKKR